MKPTYRQSNLVHFFTCEERFYQSLTADIPQNSAMEDGLLFETLVFGQKKEPSEGERTQRNRRQNTLDIITDAAEKVRPFFVLDKGEAFVKMVLERDDYILQGEADFIGTVWYNREPIRAIADLKYTGDIDRIWNKKTRRHEYLQAVMYPYLHLKLTGERLPFVYYIVESKHDIRTTPFVKQVMIEASDYDFEWLESVFSEVSSRIFYEPNTSQCLGGGFGGYRCPFLGECRHGRELLAPVVKFNFSDLEV